MLLLIRNKSKNLITLGVGLQLKSKDTTIVDEDLVTDFVLKRINNLKSLNLIDVTYKEKQVVESAPEVQQKSSSKTKSTKKSKK